MGKEDDYQGEMDSIVTGINFVCGCSMPRFGDNLQELGDNLIKLVTGLNTTEPNKRKYKLMLRKNFTDVIAVYKRRSAREASDLNLNAQEILDIFQQCFEILEVKMSSSLQCRQCGKIVFI